MKYLTVSLLSLSISSIAFAGTAMKEEGSCTGKLRNGTPVSYTYYSNFNGCKSVSTSAVQFSSGFEGLLTGTRSFSETSDNYTFNSFKLSFANSTGNTTGKLTYKDPSTGYTKTVTLQCEVRDYEYSDC